MKNIYSNIVEVNKNNIQKAINYLKRNELIGVPTETVYGLAGNAYNRISVKKIYSLKKRPVFNPLIIHYYKLKDLENDVKVNEDFKKLYSKLCPGPITFVLNKRKKTEVNNLALTNLNTIAVRFPQNSVIRKILKSINFPLAIPSANMSSGISPVEARDVVKEFGNKIKIVVNGGHSIIGIESTVIDLTGRIKILRPGAISVKKIEKILGKKIYANKNIKKLKSPGMIKKHYSPGIPMKLNQSKSSKNEAFIIFGKKYKKTNHTFNLSKKSDLNEAAKNLFKTFRKIKEKGYKKINVVKIPSKGIGIAINDRLKHAAN